mmetsp:Transcript_3995/g.8853  ORF Transcript_3995/g.8853 Transcript_3995/m.8853 type:complete len:134 (+) Transcript_3995:81-482(+)|eukprot:CAMPEP_0183731392 /NCGR_PEP_ID=MMETSP0737-20130205/35289_1 /TAXON_ID=385413 /ORGANISM="Thalassiosira miniscula, Strain CCMP1093" /LENGTH=133 /DNA_ID=CAMNT_0025964105 /DNA_START=4 /DNA_END=405 /DNA_ORIENTATION=+
MPSPPLSARASRAAIADINDVGNDPPSAWAVRLPYGSPDKLSRKSKAADHATPPTGGRALPSQCPRRSNINYRRPIDFPLGVDDTAPITPAFPSVPAIAPSNQITQSQTSPDNVTIDVSGAAPPLHACRSPII